MTDPVPLPSQRQIDKAHATMMQDYIAAMVNVSGNFDLVGVEMPYSYYGNRGILDVVLKSKEPLRGRRQWLVAELKPELLDVGRAVRQVTKARKYSFKDEEMKRLLGDEAYDLTHVLVMLATEENLQRAMDYCHLLRNIHIMFFSSRPGQTKKIAGKYAIFRAIKKAQGVSVRPEPDLSYIG